MDRLRKADWASEMVASGHTKMPAGVKIKFVHRVPA